MHPIWGALATGATFYGLAILYSIYRYYIKKRKANFENKHFFITGGSLGLGASLAKKLWKLGAYVTIVARNEEKLKEVANEAAKNASGKIQHFSFNMCNPNVKDVDSLIDNAENSFGPIDYLICNAGSSMPAMFLDADPEFFDKQINLNYLGYVKCSQPVAKRMAARKSGTIVYVSSALGIMNCPGYSPYSPTKHAIKSLADTVQMELQAYGVKVHLYLPGTLLTPGYEEENKMKPELTKKIEGTASSVTADEAANILLNGIIRGDYYITTELIFEYMMVSSVGCGKRDNFLFNIATAPISVLLNYLFNLIIWKEVKGYKPAPRAS